MNQDGSISPLQRPDLCWGFDPANADSGIVLVASNNPQKMILSELIGIVPQEPPTWNLLKLGMPNGQGFQLKERIDSAIDPSIPDLLEK